MERQDEIPYTFGYFYFIGEKNYTKVTTQNGGKANIKCLPCFTSSFQGPKQLKMKKGANIIFWIIPYNLLYIGSIISNWKGNIEYMIFLPANNQSNQWKLMLYKNGTS